MDFAVPNMCSIECSNKDADDRINASIIETTKVDLIDSEDDSGEDE